MSFEERFWAKVAMREPGECWEWTAARTKTGYGRFNVGNQRVTWAHRVSYELANGPIPDGLQIDHLCRNRACVNPAHLEAVTIKENLLRGKGFSAINARKTHCKYGHPFDEANTYTASRNRRQCRACARAYQARRRAAA